MKEREKDKERKKEREKETDRKKQTERYREKERERGEFFSATFCLITRKFLQIVKCNIVDPPVSHAGVRTHY